MKFVTIPATDLTRGMTTYVKSSRGKMQRDVKLGNPFITSGRPAFWDIAFHADNDSGLVVYSPIAMVTIGIQRSKKSRRPSSPDNYPGVAGIDPSVRANA